MKDELDELLADLEVRIERVRSLYEQFFLGIERSEPLVARKDVARLFMLLNQRTLRNTAVRFRYQTLLYRWNFLQTRWGKVLREIEAGTHVRQLARVQRRKIQLPPELRAELGGHLHASSSDAEADVAAAGAEAIGPAPARRDIGGPIRDDSESLADLVRELEENHLPWADAIFPPEPRPAAGGNGQVAKPPAAQATDAQRPAARPAPGAPPRPTPVKPPPSSAAARPPIPGMSETELRELHRRYVTARGAEVKYETLVANLERQLPTVMQRLRCAEVRFDVVNDDGKISLRASAKRNEK